MDYKKHPLLSLSDLNHQSNQPVEDQSFKFNFKAKEMSWLDKFKRSIGFYLYPIKNSFEKKQALKAINKICSNRFPKKVAHVLSMGQKGTAAEIYLAKIKKIIRKRPEVVLIYGCGTGEEVFNIVKYLRPEKVIAIDYFNYKIIWQSITERVKIKYGVDVEFMQVDFGDPQTRLLDTADIIYSQAVLEHLRDMDSVFSTLKSFLKKGGYFAAQWGPMWYGFSGDHIAAELGLHKGFEHLLLNATEYFDFYKSHPRNATSVSEGDKTWLELGLHNFATYAEYIESLRKYFGSIHYLHWVVSEEAIIYQNRFPANWDKILELNPFISGFDLMVPCASILLKHES